MKTIAQISENHLCCGCGVCSYLDPQQIQMVDDLDQGRRPLMQGPPQMTDAHRQAVNACPGQSLAHDSAGQEEVIQELLPNWGPVLEIWQGHATDSQIRFAGSSGGVATALAAFAIEQMGFAGALHIAARSDRPIFNETVFSTSRDQLLERTGSRYSPASPCDKLHWIEEATAPCVFIGKPCDVAATFKARKVRPKLDQNLGLTIGIFCAGTPTTRGTLETLKAMGIDDPDSVKSLRYRGNGWPGNFTAEVQGENGSIETKEISYQDSWGKTLQKHRQWRCYICPDHTGEFADIAVGDPWHNPPDGETPGRSLVVVRSQRGKAFLEAAVQAGVVTLERSEPKAIELAQPYLRDGRKILWPRLMTLRVMGAYAPSFTGFNLFRDWMQNTSLLEKLHSIVSTAKRVISKRLYRGRPVTPTKTET
ncbi:Coenzyme F420 hydrogenase/dehydrogenase, beta subunit C-terminal domain [Blastopirellula marina]|uniref:Coenzyme F420 hydrogenase n=1 Tax=Blastopirellula marina TaxID=124 RepID=A0A2S8F9F1_9BACT|nr:Coenzyme F420 hydrogenase/dehydrogenase, beta subunit C-terminal domain [Blastopirellula marina]PQO28765.1 coenzyme F420 hydrogenase [Blastopirellula marina]PTL42038.1 coenzyme F420 hydrogenase [Blastopirellula marina]